MFPRVVPTDELVGRQGEVPAVNCLILVISEGKVDWWKDSLLIVVFLTGSDHIIRGKDLCKGRFFSFLRGRLLL